MNMLFFAILLRHTFEKYKTDSTTIIMFFEHLGSFAEEIGRRGHVVYRSGEPVSARTSDIKVPMNGRPLDASELYSIPNVDFRGEKYRAERHYDPLDAKTRQDGIYLPDINLMIPSDALEDAHDSHHLSYCAQREVVPLPQSFLGFLNREEIKRILES